MLREWSGLVMLATLVAPVRAEVGLDRERLGRIDEAVTQALAAERAPGAVVLILHRGKVIHQKAYGARQVEPTREAMTLDTVFDLASLTKPIATGTAVLLLVEEGKLRLTDPVGKHLPAFAGPGCEKVTLEHLLLHTAGLPAGNSVRAYEAGKDAALEAIARLKRPSQPGERFVYSDLGYIVLGAVVEKVSGLSLDQFCRRRIFEPLGMRDTGFRPAPALASRCAPTEQVNGRWLRGEVHDPRARALGGVAGHAGLFGTADDLARYAGILLEGGGKLMRPETVALFTAPREVPGGKRTPGWDARTGYSAPRGRYLDGFGHTGFTGTSLWIDPASQTAIIILTNRVHPRGKGNVTALRSAIATLVAEALPRPVRTGLDVLRDEKFKRLVGKRVALVTNHTGVDSEGRRAIDLLHAAPGVKLVTLFSPEHGIAGTIDDLVRDGKDVKTGLPIHSLYGKARRPSKEQLAGVDVLVYDIQDAGCRFYTYASTLGYLMEEAARHGVAVMVLDRPNPLGGDVVEGPLRDEKGESFVAYHRVPLRHGLTVGELALLFNAERKLGARLEVVRMEHWRRGDLFDRTGLTWRNPSPNLRSLTAALLYPGVGLLEMTNVSVGRGTDRPFEQIGAPWLDGRALALRLNAAGLPGLRFVPTGFTPTSSTHANQECGGVQIYITDWSRFESVPLGLALAAALRDLHPMQWKATGVNRLLVCQAIAQALQEGTSAAELLRLAEPGRQAFLASRRRFLLY
ncbi:MAG: DUF1343 domain-containing protein [Gemmataceae bacterium]